MRKLYFGFLVLSAVTSCNVLAKNCEEAKAEHETHRVRLEENKIPEIEALIKKYEGFLFEDNAMIAQLQARLRYEHNSRQDINLIQRDLAEYEEHKQKVVAGIERNEKSIKMIKIALKDSQDAVESQCKYESLEKKLEENRLKREALSEQFKENQARQNEITEKLRVFNNRISACQSVDESRSMKILCGTAINRGIEIPVENIFTCSNETSSDDGFFNCILMGNIVTPRDIRECADKTWFPGTFHECLKGKNQQ